MTMRWLRRTSQILVFAIFVFLFLNTEYKDTDILPYAVNIFLRLDPLVAATTMLAARAIITLVWPALIVVVATLVFGRFFCGWVCPLGTLLDGVSWLIGKRPQRQISEKWYGLKYLALALLTGSALFGFQLVFLFDPISILIRSLAIAVYPGLNFATNALFNTLYETDVTAVTAVSEPVFGFLRNHFLAFEQPYFQTAVFTGILFLAILALEYIDRRFWCRYLCPLGATFGLLGRFGLIRRNVSEPDCTGCGICERECRMGAIGDSPVATDRAECLACFDCEALCPEKAIRFTRTGEVESLAPADPSRRSLLWSIGLGMAAAPLFGSEAIAKTGHPARIRPPGALAEDEFLARCTRCGECMRVCIANGLQPALFEAGLAGLWSPVLISRIGYCEYNCTLCGQVCPTGAIEQLQLAKKQKIKIGLAEIDRSRCLPWEGRAECIVCEEHCPTPEKAIRLRHEPVFSITTGKVETLKRPYVDEKLCIGCGICETKCPLSDRSAIIVTSRGETRGGGNEFSGY